ncbi:MAG: EAL domain-containing protein [Cyanobacteriota bacterium]|nr:EAL domain-containing protein [Cyanobacteriota bacterium]
MSNASELRHVLVIEDQKSRRIVPLTENTYDLGRDPTSAIPIYDRQVSRHHATLLRVNDYQNQHFTYRIIDGNLQGKRSTNGILVNGQYCLSHELKQGDEVRFGSKSKANYQVINLDTESGLNKLSAVSPGDDPLSSPLEGDLFSGPQNFDPEEEESAFSTAIIYQDPPAPVSDDLKHPTQQDNLQSTLAQFSPEAIIELTPEGKIAYANPAALALFPDLNSAQGKHPLFAGILTLSPGLSGASVEREITLGGRIFQQYVSVRSNQMICCYCREITEQRLLEQRCAQLEKQLQLYRQSIRDGLVIIDADTKNILDASPSYCQLLGYSLPEITRLNLYQLVSGDRESVNASLAPLQSQTDLTLEAEHRRADGGLVPVLVQGRRQVWNQLPVYCLTVSDRREQEIQAERLQALRLHHPVTELPNRLFIERELQLALSHAQHHNHALGVMFIHLETLKPINQAYGHQMGDAALKAFYRLLQGCVREGDQVGHWGGAVFAVILAQIKNPQDTLKLAERIFEQLQAPLVIEKRPLSLSCNLGIAVYPSDGETAAVLLTDAEAALQKGRLEGHNQYQFYNASYTQEAVARVRLGSLLEQALVRKQLNLVYQPQIDLQTGKVVGLEALLRWEHPEVGFVPPAKIIPLAAQSNLIFQLGEWILKTAAQQALAWQKEGLPPLPLGVNLCEREFYRAEVAAFIGRILAETGLDPQWLEIEITEATLRHNPQQAKKNLGDLHNLGVNIALDDFGTGHTALGFISQFPLQTLKIDQRLIRNLRGTPTQLALISSLLAFSQGYQYRLVAEGVETEEQLAWLRQCHCPQAQGFWFSEPLRAKEMGQFLQRQV